MLLKHAKMLILIHGHFSHAVQSTSQRHPLERGKSAGQLPGSLRAGSFLGRAGAAACSATRPCLQQPRQSCSRWLVRGPALSVGRYTTRLLTGTSKEATWQPWGHESPSSASQPVHGPQHRCSPQSTETSLTSSIHRGIHSNWLEANAILVTSLSHPPAVQSLWQGTLCAF